MNKEIYWCVFCLPLTREVDFAKQKTEGENNISPPASLRSAAPSSEGAFACGEIQGAFLFEVLLFGQIVCYTAIKR